MDIRELRPGTQDLQTSPIEGLLAITPHCPSTFMTSCLRRTQTELIID